ncbi:MAG: CoB--CoM heterodisulfide reductase iron-sulfur subunit B family protein [Dehalogenimonas sp.]|uniref:CoB--CoM heterodisulfide reductase iron-sulfur subunit B family protein n=1 Tax=Candidatus Dehalogenimonas loeffleri TaxID=3127115 RepID=A0ABZ2J2S9_9CHLR|nr:CoB--CoM heterodisulfide reductase iron-sulfur subunit B family protein [Dehalogenimonas sp.]
MKYAYYNSCSLRSTGKEYDNSLQHVFKALDIELEEPKNWVCCGSTLAHNASVLLADTLPLKNLAEVEKMGLDEVMVPCTACYNRFKIAQYEHEDDRRIRHEIEDIIGHTFQKDISVLHPLEILALDQNLEKLKTLVKRDLSHLKVVSYYGCLLVRPHKETQFRDNPEYPVTMDRILSAIGIKTLDWSHKVECCGGSLSITRPDVVLDLTSRILDDAKAVGATAVAVPCTFCQLNLDIRQEDLAKRGKTYDMPIYYFTELIALALGIPERELMLGKHFVESEKVLARAT